MNLRHTPNVDRLFFGFLLACLTLFAVGAAPVHADPPAQTETFKLLASEGVELDHFGISVSLDGDTAVIGAPNYPFQPTGPGSAYVFNRDKQGAWTEHTRLVACDALCGDGFGHDVAMDGDTIIVGAPADDGSELSSGAAYIYTRNGADNWIQQTKLVVFEPEVGALGVSVALDGDTAVIGATSGPGRVFVFIRDQYGNWSQQAMLIAEVETATLFGFEVAVQGDTIIVGTPFFHTDNEPFIGAAFVFTRDETGAWSQQAQLMDPDPQPSANLFGYSVAIDGDTAVIGALTFTLDRAYIFTRDEQGDWSVQQILDPDLPGSDNFGASADIQCDTLVVGATHDGPDGSAYVYTRDRAGVWSQQLKLFQSDGGGNDNFGTAVALDAETILVGARADDDNGNASGSAYLFDAAGPGMCPWDLDGTGTIGVSDLLSLLASWGPCKGCPADFDGNGNVGVSDLLALLANWGPCP